MRVGVLTGGGDCPGLNAALRAVTLALAPQAEVLGFERGFHGLLARRWRVLDEPTVRDLLDEGGTLLGTHNRCDPFDWQGRDASAEALAGLQAAGVDVLVAIGGDGTLGIAHRFARLGVPVVGVPKTIDNDIVGNERSFGFDSAVTLVADALTRLRTTARSHGRVMLVETMGRHVGWIALEGGLSGNADAVLVPEQPVALEALAEHLSRRLDRQGHALVCVAEGARLEGGDLQWQRLAHGVQRLGGVAQQLAEALGERFDTAFGPAEVRATVLGHLQRGGMPTPFDRLLATRFGLAAAQAVRDRAFDCTVALQGDRVVRVPLTEVAGRMRSVPLDDELMQAARALDALPGA